MSSDNRFQPLPSELRRRRELADHEATHGLEWIDGCPPEAARRIASALTILTNAAYRVYDEADRRRGYASSGETPSATTEKVLGGLGDEIERLDAVAAVAYAFVWLADHDNEDVDSYESYVVNSEPVYEVDKFLEVLNDILLSHRVDWVYEDGRFQERGNAVLHAEVTRPATVLLDSHPTFAAASSGFQTALTRLAKNEPDVAITDAGTAVQEFFRALGVAGNSISDQLNNAVNSKIITPYDRLLLKPITDWVNSDRSSRGNAHHYRESDASKADAWLAIHVAGALMVRLSDQEPRDILAARDKRTADAAAVVAERERQAREQADAAASSAWANNSNDVWNTQST